MNATNNTSVIAESIDAVIEMSSEGSQGMDDKYVPELKRIPLIWGYSTVIIVTILGNLLVIIAYIRHPQVRAIPTNTLIFSLSVSDFLIGAFVLTINLHWVAEDSWMFDEIVCRLWSTLDYTSTFMSTVTIVLISLDRFVLMTQKTRYRVVWTRKRVSIILLVGWLCSLVIYSAIAFSMSGSDLVDFESECELEAVYLLPFTIGILIFEFGVPLPIIMFLNMSVYYKIHQRSKNLRQIKSDIGLPSSDSRRGNESGMQLEGQSASYGTDPSDIQSASYPNSDRWAESLVAVIGSRRNQPDSFLTPQRNNRSTSNYHNTSRDAGTQRIAVYQRHKRLFVRHKKAALTLSILVGTFLICWLPYEIVSILQAMCGEDECFSETTWEVVNGLLWGNSALNPILYGLTNPTLRRYMFKFGRRVHCECRPVVRVGSEVR